MSAAILPYLVEPAELAAALARPGAAPLLLVYLGKHDHYLAGHIPGALWFDARRLNGGIAPAPGLLPDPQQLETDFGAIGLGPSTHVVCHDDDGGTAGARMMWVLEAMGHSRMSMLNGGLEAWQTEGLMLDRDIPVIEPANPAWKARPNTEVLATKQDVLAALGNPRIRILDSRSKDEFLGRKTNSARKGRIPGARSLDWQSTRDPANAHRLLPQKTLWALLAAQGIDPRLETIVHCQTHQRSSHSFVMLRALGFNHLRAYAGSWMEWAADDSLPIIREDDS